MTDTIHGARKDTVRYKFKKCMVWLLHYIQRLIILVGRKFYEFYYRNSHQCVPPVKNPLILESATSLAEKIRTKQVTSEEVLKAYIERIKEVNPITNCFVDERFDDALKEAKEADALIASGKMTAEQIAKEKPYLGVPFTTKDCIAVKGLIYSSGIYLRKDIKADEDSEVVQYTRESGAIPIGLTNVSELCMWWESHNHVHGRTNNPYDASRIVGGSSGGEGCIQAAVGSAFGIGSDIGGSIRMPAIFNGVFGHKPSRNIVSIEGQYPPTCSDYQASFLGVGPMTRYAVDLKPLLKIMAHKNASKLNLDQEVDVKKVRVFYQRNCLSSPLVCDIEPAIQAAMISAVGHMRRICDTKPTELKLEKLAKSSSIWFANMKVKEDVSFGCRITGKEDNTTIFKEIFKSMFGLSKNTFIALVSALVDQGGPEPGTPEYQYFFKLRQELEDEIAAHLKDDGVLFYPTHPTVAPYHNEPILRSFNFSYTAIINVLGFPSTHVPMGLNEEGLPVGIQVIANINNDKLCLAVAEELEKAFGGWVEPSCNKKEN